MSGDDWPVGRVAILALFVTALVTAQLTASKVLSIPLPVGLPRVGSTIFLPGAALAYALTFFASDCYGELYGRRDAQVMVNVGFVMNFVLLALVWSTISRPVETRSSRRSSRASSPPRPTSSPGVCWPTSSARTGTL